MRLPARLVVALLVLPVLSAGCAPPAPESPADQESGTAAALFDQGVPFPVFLEGAESRVAMWNRNWNRAQVPPELLERGRAVPGQWRLLVVAEDYCGDSANSVPYVGRLDEALENLEVRIVDSEAGREVMERYPTPDGRSATPTMVLLDAGGTEAGCLVEQPQPLQEWWLGDALEEHPEMEDRLEVKYAWYDDDDGRSTLTEVVEMMEGAAAGVPECRVWSDPQVG